MLLDHQVVVCHIAVLLFTIRGVLLTSDLPGPPSSIHADIQRGFIIVTWKPPLQNPDKVAYYEINYKVQNRDGMVLKVNNTAEKTMLAGIICQSTYTIYMRSVSSTGEKSSMSAVQVVTTGEIKPSAPKRVWGQVIDKIKINVAWTEPEENPGAVTAYNIYYKPLENVNQTLQNMDSISVEFHNHTSYLENLTEFTTYEICVTSKNLNYESVPSEPVRIMTLSEKETTTVTISVTEPSSEPTIVTTEPVTSLPASTQPYRQTDSPAQTLKPTSKQTVNIVNSCSKVLPGGLTLATVFITLMNMWQSSRTLVVADLLLNVH